MPIPIQEEGPAASSSDEDQPVSRAYADTVPRVLETEPEASTSSKSATTIVPMSKAKSDIYIFSAFLSFSGFLQLVMTFMLTKFLADMGGKDLEASDVIMTTETLLMTMMGGALYSVSTMMGGPVDFIYELELALLKQISWGELKTSLDSSLKITAETFPAECGDQYKKGFEKAVKVILSAAMKEQADKVDEAILVGEEDSSSIVSSTPQEAVSSDVESGADDLEAKLNSLFVEAFGQDDYAKLRDDAFKQGVSKAVSVLKAAMLSEGVFLVDLKTGLQNLAQIVSPVISAAKFEPLSLDFRGYFEAELEKLQKELFIGGDPEDRISGLMKGDLKKQGSEDASLKMSQDFYDTFYKQSGLKDQLGFVRKSKAYVGKYYQGGLALTAMSSVPLVATFGLAKYLFLRGESPAVQQVSMEFFYGFMASVPFTGVYLTQIQLFLSTGRNLAMPALTGLNTGLSLLFSYLLGMRYGAFGLGLGCTVGAASTAALVTAYLALKPFYKDHQLHGFLKTPGGVSLRKYINELWILGRAKGVQAAGELAGVSVMTAMTTFFDDPAYAKGQSIALQYLLFVIWIPYNIGPVVTRLVAGRLEVNDHQSAKRYIDVGLKLASRLSLFFMLTMGGAQLVLMLLSLGNKNPMITFFTDDPHVADAAGKAILLNLLNLWFDYQRTVGAGVLSGFKDVDFAMWNSVLVVVCLGSAIGGLLGFQFDMGVDGLYLGRDAGIFLASLNLFRRYHWFANNIDKALTHMHHVAESTSDGILESCKGVLASCTSALFSSPNRSAEQGQDEPLMSDQASSSSDANTQAEENYSALESFKYYATCGYWTK